MNEIMEKIGNVKLRTNKNKLHQTDARTYKDLLHEMLITKLSELDVDITEVENGFIMEIPHEELGSVVVEVKGVIKPLDYDVVSAGEQHQEKNQARLDKLAEKKKKSEERK